MPRARRLIHHKTRNRFWEKPTRAEGSYERRLARLPFHRSEGWRPCPGKLQRRMAFQELSVGSVPDLFLPPGWQGPP
jgi:hypothetical protein